MITADQVRMAEIGGVIQYRWNGRFWSLLITSAYIRNDAPWEITGHDIHGNPHYVCGAIKDLELIACYPKDHPQSEFRRKWQATPKETRSTNESEFIPTKH